MANLPRGANSLNGGLAYTGAPAYGNPVAAEMVNPAQAQVQQAVQQETTRSQTREQAQASQLAVLHKSALQKLLGREGLPNLAAIAADPGLVDNLGLS